MVETGEHNNALGGVIVEIKCKMKDCFGIGRKDGMCHVLKECIENRCPFYQNKEKLAAKEARVYGKPIERRWQ